jgi:hypothetical protein
MFMNQRSLAMMLKMMCNVPLPRLLAGCLSVLLAGCDLTGTKVIRVSGVVTRGGKPVPNLFLNFLPEQGRPSWGVTDDKGNFVLHYDKSRDGAVAGLHSIFVTFKPSDIRAEKAPVGTKVRPPDDLIPILAKYGDPQRSLLKVQVNNNDQFIKLELD